MCSTSGTIRSRVVANVIRKNTTHTTAHRPIVISQPVARAVAPSPYSAANLATSGSVKPVTTSWARFTATKRYALRLVRSSESPVITPPRAAYGMLFAE